MAWEEVVEFANSSVGIALGVGGDAVFAYNGTIKVSKWAYANAIAAATAIYGVFSSNDGSQSGTVKCGLCGQPGHNRRTCEFNAVCGNCGNEEPEEIWELDGNYCCDSCLDHLDI